MEPRLISLVINMAVNSTQRLQIFPSVYHFSHCEFNVLSELVILGGGVSILKTLCHSYIKAFAIYDHNFQKGLVRQKLVLFRRCEKKWVPATYCWG